MELPAKSSKQKAIEERLKLYNQAHDALSAGQYKGKLLSVNTPAELGDWIGERMSEMIAELR